MKKILLKMMKMKHNNYNILLNVHKLTLDIQYIGFSLHSYHCITNNSITIVITVEASDCILICINTVDEFLKFKCLKLFQ